MNNLVFKDLDIIHVTKKSLKNSYISISPEAEILLKTPNVPHSFVLKLLNEKEAWIRKKISKIKQYPVLKVNLEDEVLLFGELYSIDTHEALALRTKLEKSQNNSTEKILKLYNSFYKECAKDHIIPKVEYFSQIMNLKYEAIKFRKMKSRWGSCSSSKILTFNTELIKVKKELIDYVVVHELAHLKHMNHSTTFHSLVDDYLPDSKKLRSELKNIKIASS